MIPKYRRPNEIDRIIELNDMDWKPLIVVGECEMGAKTKTRILTFSHSANSKSGDNTASDVLAAFRTILNPIQVFELSSHGPANALNLLSKMTSTQCRVLVAGGDGTVGWISTEISRRNISPVPEVCILPIGTGNDLSRVLGWGAVPPDVLNPSDMCEKVRNHLPPSNFG